MTSHVHIIIGSKKDKLEDIVRDMKKHTSTELKTAIKNNAQGSRQEWIIWIACPDSSHWRQAKEYPHWWESQCDIGLKRKSNL